MSPSSTQAVLNVVSSIQGKLSRGAFKDAVALVAAFTHHIPPSPPPPPPPPPAEARFFSCCSTSGDEAPVPVPPPQPPPASGGAKRADRSQLAAALSDRDFKRSTLDLDSYVDLVLSGPVMVAAVGGGESGVDGLV